MTKIAAFTMARNENTFLPIWFQHNSRQFGREHCYILDHGSSDGSTSGFGWNCIRLPSSSVDATDRTDIVMRFQRFLLASYDVVIFSDTDEIIVADPRYYSSVGELIDKTPHDVIGGVGLSLTHAQDIERKIDLHRPILEQRRFVRFENMYCKPLIGRKPITWHPGFHRCKEEIMFNRRLYIFHLKSFDLGIALMELGKKRRSELSERSKQLGHSVQFYFTDQEMLDTYFPLRGVDFPCRGKDDFSIDNLLRDAAKSNMSDFWNSFKETFELPDALRSSF